MSQKLETYTGGHGGVSFFCPGCGYRHYVTTGEGAPARWSWNGDLEKPTLTPSVLVRSGHYVPGSEAEDCWCTFEERTGREPHFKCGVCHSFVTDGRIQYLGDCTHHLAGQTIDLPDISTDPEA